MEHGTASGRPVSLRLSVWVLQDRLIERVGSIPRLQLRIRSTWYTMEGSTGIWGRRDEDEGTRRVADWCLEGVAGHREKPGPKGSLCPTRPSSQCSQSVTSRLLRPRRVLCFCKHSHCFLTTRPLCSFSFLPPPDCKLFIYARSPEHTAPRSFHYHPLSIFPWTARLFDGSRCQMNLHPSPSLVSQVSLAPNSTRLRPLPANPSANCRTHLRP